MWFYLLFLPLVLGGCGLGGSKCDEWSPCCSEHGFCGKDYSFCGLGCQANGTYDASCLLPPACQNRHDTFQDGTRVIPREDYFGDYRQTDWVATGKYSVHDEGIEIIMPKNSGGGRITSTRYVHFGTITTRLKIAGGAGVVTSFITMADDFDEIDWEWVGADPGSSQSNYYSKGVRDFTNGGTHSVSSSDTQFHDYTILWTPDLLQWHIDGKVVRSLEKKGPNFPTSPSRIEIGLWDGGSGSKGTSDWAGGKIDWDAPEVAKRGHFSVTLQSVTIKCTGQPSSSDNDFQLTFQNKTNFTSSNYSPRHSTMVIKGKRGSSDASQISSFPIYLILAGLIRYIQ